MKILFFISVLFVSISAQPEMNKWKPKTVDYVFVVQKEKDYKSNSIFSHLQNVYTFLISEPDGDNCPFSPSCSNFFVEAVEKTNFFSGTLLFMDRFTRDMNPIKNLKQYQKISDKKLYDPVENYLFD
ncbi:MAG: membrane protein insertion efficiency factor YidD [Melioribacteraceae bacterium]|nr:membrane protein insertion efficiency factor YidD [Melioribacteraceae bacterium]